jgi:UPF0271 protein
MKKFTINCDMGEGVTNEEAIMPYLDYCNIACGGHTGSVNSMEETIELALKNNVKIGAHPSYPDRINFGRKSIAISNKNLVESIRTQVDHLIKIAKTKNAILFHIKPHGALYNDIAKNKIVAQAFIKAITPYKSNLKLFVPYKSEIEQMAIENNFEIIYEAFADRNYNDDLSLVSRNQSNALIKDLNNLIQNVACIITTGKVNSVQNKKIAIKAETFCVHSDTKNAFEYAKELNKLLQKHINE